MPHSRELEYSQVSHRESSTLPTTHWTAENVWKFQHMNAEYLRHVTARLRRMKNVPNITARSLLLHVLRGCYDTGR